MTRSGVHVEVKDGEGDDEGGAIKLGLVGVEEEVGLEVQKWSARK